MVIQLLVLGTPVFVPDSRPNDNHHVSLVWNINMIKVEGLTKRYARTVAVDDISFEVEKGQIVGFLGPNGAGKTTTMRVLTCFLPPSSGKANIAGFDVLEQPQEVKKRIGYLPETPPLYPEMEVTEYLKFVGQLKGISSADIKNRTTPGSMSPVRVPMTRPAAGVNAIVVSTHFPR